MTLYKFLMKNNLFEFDCRNEEKLNFLQDIYKLNISKLDTDKYILSHINKQEEDLYLKFGDFSNESCLFFSFNRGQLKYDVGLFSRRNAFYPKIDPSNFIGTVLISKENRPLESFGVQMKISNYKQNN